MPGFLYILQDDTSKFYIGSSENIEARFADHLFGGTYTTRRMKNPKMVFSQGYPTIAEAKKIELKLKKLKRKDYIANIVKDGYIKMKI